ncbi:MAG: murein transglycosylase, partial [Leptolyngbyaceae cyanobacterium SL_5_14]|nr:murein transglycosylase [Leptolyngbyaceae cyanobacterium SL_5_14]
IPYTNFAGELEPRLVSRFVLDQDTGGAIRGAGRVDIFMGTGDGAGDRAGLINGTGQLYYLLLKD